VTHEPVMAHEVIAALVTEPAGVYVDGTVGEGGHARAILEALSPAGRLLGLDRDATAIESARAALAGAGERVVLRRERFSRLPEIAGELGWREVDGILLDLGLRSDALDDPARGFSFQADGPLDMRFDPSAGMSAADLLRHTRPEELERRIEEGTTRARPQVIVRAILEARRRHALRTTGDLVACLRAALGRHATPKLLSSVFAALRMAVNDEMEELETALATMPLILKTGGVLCVLSYQSLEDRRVKGVARTEYVDRATRRPFRMTPLWKGPRRATLGEIALNSRARSARLRALRRSSPIEAS
jgi:16S rRNA (cytosine1402-N4)-methyltransferase